MNRGMMRTLAMGLVIGLVMVALGLLMGGRTSLSVDWKGVHVPSGKPEKLIVEEQLAFDEMVINVSVANVIVTRGDRFSIKAEYHDGIKPSYSLSGGVLKIEDDGARTFKLNFGFFNPGNRVEVTLPGRRLERAEIRSEVGDVKLNGVEAGTLTLHTSTGDMGVNGVSCDQLYGNAGVGDIRLDSSAARLVDMRAGTGSITGKSLTFDEGKFDCGVGDGTLAAISSGKLYLHSGTGSVSAHGELRGESRITSGVGSVEVTTSLPRSDYRVQAHAKLGKVWLKPEGGADNGPHTLIMESGVGSVSCEFAR